jgi:hypothetical protein
VTKYYTPLKFVDFRIVWFDDHFMFVPQFGLYLSAQWNFFSPYLEIITELFGCNRWFLLQNIFSAYCTAARHASPHCWSVDLSTVKQFKTTVTISSICSFAFNLFVYGKAKIQILNRRDRRRINILCRITLSFKHNIKMCIISFVVNLCSLYVLDETTIKCFKISSLNLFR